MGQIFDGKRLAAEIKISLQEQVAHLTSQWGRRPALQVLLAGNDYGSLHYAESCIKQANALGFHCELHRLAETATEEEVITEIERVNDDPAIDGLLVQMPLPKHLPANRIINHLRSDKDVDGITDANIAALWKQRTTDYSLFSVPCTPRSVMRILQEMGISLDGKRAVVVGRSNIVGLPVAKLLMNANCTVTVAHSHTRNLPDLLREADIVVAAIGQPKFITADMISENAVVIDVGINSDPLTGKMVGDVDYAAIADRCSWVTPVPGGVGPLTICSLLENTLACYQRHLLS